MLMQRREFLPNSRFSKRDSRALFVTCGQSGGPKRVKKRQCASSIHAQGVALAGSYMKRYVVERRKGRNKKKDVIAQYNSLNIERSRAPRFKPQVPRCNRWALDDVSERASVRLPRTRIGARDRPGAGGPKQREKRGSRGIRHYKSVWWATHVPSKCVSLSASRVITRTPAQRDAYTNRPQEK